MTQNCMPEVVGAQREYEGVDYYGEAEYSVSFEYNCHNCDNEECGYYSDFHFTNP